jgi:hypothetical protein
MRGHLTMAVVLMKMGPIQNCTGMSLSLTVPAGVFSFVISEGSETTITLIFQQFPS